MTNFVMKMLQQCCNSVEARMASLLITQLPTLCFDVRSPVGQLVSKVVISNICQRIEILRDVDAQLSKPAFRALMIILTKVINLNY